MVSAATWGRESHGLFDYSSSSVTRKELKTTSSAALVRMKNEVKMIADAARGRGKAMTSHNLTPLAVISISDDAVFIDKRSEEAISPLWIVARSVPLSSEEKGVVLRQGDVFRLGRVVFVVRELRAGKVRPLKADVSSGASLIGEKPLPIASTPSDAICRICLSGGDADDALYAPCVCSGSVKHVHFSCLRKWLSSIAAIKSHRAGLTYFWQSAHCELCKAAFPTAFRTEKGESLSLLTCDQPESNSIVLETLPREGETARAVHVLSIGTSMTLRLGRGADCDVRVNDISVSRCHAFIERRGDAFVLRDNAAKFGTLVLARDRIPLDVSSPIEVQAGRTLFSFSLRHRTADNFQGPLFISSLFESASTTTTNGRLLDEQVYRCHTSRKKSRSTEELEACGYRVMSSAVKRANRGICLRPLWLLTDQDEDSEALSD